MIVVGGSIEHEIGGYYAAVAIVCVSSSTLFRSRFRIISRKGPWIALATAPAMNTVVSRRAITTLSGVWAVGRAAEKKMIGIATAHAVPFAGSHQPAAVENRRSTQVCPDARTTPETNPKPMLRKKSCRTDGTTIGEILTIVVGSKPSSQAIAAARVVAPTHTHFGTAICDRRTSHWA